MKYQRVIRHGHSLAVVIPAQMARELGVNRGDGVRLQLLAKGIPGEEMKLFYLEIEPLVNDQILADTQSNG